MYFKKMVSATLLATLLFPAVQNIEYVDAAEYSIDVVVDTVEIDINDIPEDRCVKVGISLYNNPGINGFIFPLEKDDRLEFFGRPPLEYPNMSLETIFLADHVRQFSLFYGSLIDDLIFDGNLCYIKFSLPENIAVGDFFSVNVLSEYIYMGGNNLVDGVPCLLSLIDKDLKFHYNENFNSITNGGIRIIGTDPSQTDSPQTDPPQTDPPQTDSPQTDPPQTDPPQTDLPQTDPLQTNPPQTDPPQSTSTTIESTTTTELTSLTSQTTVTTTENTTSATTSTVGTTTSDMTSTSLESTTETSEVTEDKEENNTKKTKSNIPVILAILASIGILGGIIGLIIRKSKGHGGN
ncbi:MAG: hypothetical protein J6A58_04575 [Oscillospiraceae bacterium]|nr:hypothetical protein [Oscillospiraceae bacterium]